MIGIIREFCIGKHGVAAFIFRHIPYPGLLFRGYRVVYTICHPGSNLITQVSYFFAIGLVQSTILVIHIINTVLGFSSRVPVGESKMDDITAIGRDLEIRTPVPV